MVVRYDAEGAMHVVSVEQGEKVSDLPIVVRAENNGALFTVAGGKNLIPGCGQRVDPMAHASHIRS